MSRSRRRALGACPVLAALLVAALAGCGTGGPAKPQARPSVSASSEDPAVKVIGLPEGIEAEVRDTSVGMENGENLDFVSPLYTVAASAKPDEELADPVTVRLALDNALPATASVLVASRDSSDQPFTFLRGYLTTDGQHVQFTTRKLNQVGVLVVDVAGALNSLKEDVRSGLDAGVSTAVRRQDCLGAAEARQDEYSAAATRRQTLFWCFGLRDGERVVQVTNRRRVPVQVAHPGVAVVDSPRSAAAWAPWVGPLGRSNTFLPPGQSATYDAELQPRSRLVLTATSTATAQSLRLLQATARALVLRLTAFGVEPPSTVATLGAMLSVPSCRRSLGRGGAGVIAGCLGPTQLATFLQPDQLLVSPLVTDPTFSTFLRARSTSIESRVRSEELQRIVVRRGAPPFEAFTGTWTGKGRALSVSGTGVVTEMVNNKASLVIRLTYQLSDPSTKGDVSSAGARITQVTVGDRKLLTGRVPQVGDTGVLRIRAGVVTPPFLRTTYCKPANRSACAG